MAEERILSEEAFNLAKQLFSEERPFSQKTIEACNRQLHRSWLTKQYLSIGRNSLVLPAWLNDQLLPNENATQSFGTIPVVANTKNRNYYMLGSPSANHEPVVDHRGGIIPKPNSYTLIFGTIVDNYVVFSSEEGEVEIELNEEGYPIVTVTWDIDGDKIIYECVSSRDEEGNEGLAVNLLRGFANHTLVIALTPFDQDGLTQIRSIEYDSKLNRVNPEGQPPILINIQPIRPMILPAKKGNAGKHILNAEVLSDNSDCGCLAASWAATFPVRSTPTFLIVLEGEDPEEPDVDDVEFEWEEELEDIPVVQTSDPDVDRLFKSSVVVLRSLADKDLVEITVGPSVQETTWLSALVFQARALDRLGFGEKLVRPVLDRLFREVTEEGYNDGSEQWETGGALVLALVNHYYQHRDSDWLGQKFNEVRKIIDSYTKLAKKQLSNPEGFMGLLPQGNPPFYDPVDWRRDYYYYHSFWMLYTLKIGSELARITGRRGDMEKIMNDMDSLKNRLDELIITKASNLPFLPAGPRLQESSALFFNLYAFYPLQLYNDNFMPLRKTLDHVTRHYLHKGGFMVFNPWNAYGSYFTIQLAQMYRFTSQFEKIPEIIQFMVNSRTNEQGWATGISPDMRSGSVGDCPNGYTAAEWINLILDIFAEERFGGDILLMRGMPRSWLENGVSCQSLLMEDGKRLSYTAKILGKKLELKYSYDGEKKLFVCVPYDVLSSKGASPSSSSVYLLDSPEGKATFALK